MASIGENLRSFFLADAGVVAIVVDSVSQNNLPQVDDAPFIWFVRSGTTNERATDDAPGAAAFRESFDVECVSTDLDQALALADLLKAFDSYRGAFGDVSVQGIFAEDHSDDYLPRNTLSDGGLHVAALSFEIIPQ